MINSKRRNLILNSSDSIVWEGEDLPCIKLCKGDTISDVVYKLAVEICEMKNAYDLKDLDISAVFNACIGCPNPVKTLQNVLLLIMNKFRSIDQIIGTLGSGTIIPAETEIVIASCFLPYIIDGDPVTKLPHATYTRLIATMVCSMMTSVNGLLSRVTTVEGDVQNIYQLINELGAEPLITPNCVTGASTPIEVSQVVSLLEFQFCQLKAATGLPTAIVAAISKQPSDLKDHIQLTGSSPMVALTGWKPTVVTEADSLNNLWLTVLDIRGALRIVLDNCCKVSCDSIIVDFSIKLNDERTEMTLFFASKSKIPVGFADCNPIGNKLTISDTAGNTTDILIKLAAVTKYTLVAGVMTENSVVIDLTTTPIDTHLDYFLNMDACLTNGDLTCQKCINKSITYKDTCSYCEISVAAQHTPVAGSELVIIYED